MNPPAGTGYAYDPNSALEPIGVPVVSIVRILRRHARLVLGCFVLVTGGTTYLVSKMPREYTAETTILVEPERTQVSDLQAISNDEGDVNALIRTQMDILSAPALAIGVVNNLKLVDDPEFRPSTGGLHAKLDGLVREITGAPPPVAVPNDPVDLAAAALAGKISFSNETHSDVLHILVTTRRPALSAQIANGIVAEYLDFKRREKFIAMQRARDWFQQQLGTLSEQVHQDETKVERYRQLHGLSETIASSSGAPQALSANRQELDAVTGLLAQVSRDRAEKEAQLGEAKLALNGSTPISVLPEVVSSPLISELVAQITTVAGREAELSVSEGAGNPELVAVRSQLARLRSRAAAQMNNIAHSLTVAVNAAREQEDGLRTRLDQLRQSVSRENSAEIGLESLETQARATRSIYESFLNRATELANTAGIQDPDAALVSTARPPLGPSSPKSTRLTLVAAILSLGLGVGLACVRERMRRGFSMPEQIEVTLGLQSLALIPTARRRLLSSGKRAALAREAAFDLLRARLRGMGDEPPKVIMITSAVPEEGKSTFAAGWARNAAQAGWKVLLVECDFARPSLAPRLGCEASPGLGEVLSGKLIGSRRAVFRRVLPKLDVIPAGLANGDPQELLASARMTRLIESARNAYNLIILDTPPVLPVADALVLGRMADATILVVRWEQTTRDAVSAAVRLLQTGGARMLGTVMTRVDPAVARRASGLKGFVYRAYGSREALTAGGD